MSRSIVANEILKTYSKWRTYIGFIAVGIVVPLVEFGLKAEGGSIIRNMTRGLGEDFLIVGNLFNAYFITYFIMNSLWIHIPFLISLVAGDQLAGEATGGTFRLMLIHPPSRTRILAAKYTTTLLYTLSLVAFLALLGLGLGLALFGTGDLLVPGGSTITVIARAEVPWRLALTFGLGIWSMWCVASLAFLFSSLVENAIGPIIGTMAVIIVFLVVSSAPITFFTEIKPYLFTTYFNVWQKAMEQPVPWSEIAAHTVYLGLYSICFYAATWYIFVTKDVLS
ncbi:MAG TPA: ABC transporter permease subunit [Bacteroidota bacterium]|nr:ABC transporter permease subunit [Bacteroidota bacterium]